MYVVGGGGGRVILLSGKTTGGISKYYNIVLFPGYICYGGTSTIWHRRRFIYSLPVISCNFNDCYLSIITVMNAHLATHGQLTSSETIKNQYYFVGWLTVPEFIKRMRIIQSFMKKFCRHQAHLLPLPNLVYFLKCFIHRYVRCIMTYLSTHNRCMCFSFLFPHSSWLRSGIPQLRYDNVLV